ncbi:MAG: hypothetical protein H7239_09590, partial [Flavobacterium sp.]|nr:hypothetical protein [Flavobacterium sp.]
EQELRQLFIEEFKKEHTDLYFSIETPTVYKYSFTNELMEICVSEKGQSALIDMCVLKKESETSNYTRLLNIEFKHKNATEANISKDILKLMHEEQNGAFVLLLKNTNTGTLTNSADHRFGVIDKVIDSIQHHYKNKENWKGGNEKSVEVVILSLEDGKKNGKPFIMQRTIFKTELETLDKTLNKWKKEELEDREYNSVDLIEKLIF